MSTTSYACLAGAVCVAAFLFVLSMQANGVTAVRIGNFGAGCVQINSELLGHGLICTVAFH